MTSIRQLISKGMREAGIIEVGGIPDGDEFEEGLDLLQGMYSSFFGNELGEPLVTVNFGKAGLSNTYAIDEDIRSDVTSAYLPVNTRYVFNIDSSETLYLSPNPQDGARLSVLDNAGNFGTYAIVLNGNGRQIEDAASVTLNTNGLNRDWFYRADLGSWMKVTDLLAEDESPLPREFDDFMSTALALRLNPRYGAQTSQEMTDILKRMRKQFRARYKQTSEQHSEIGIYRLPSNRYWMYTSNSNTFNRGKF